VEIELLQKKNEENRESLDRKEGPWLAIWDQRSAVRCKESKRLESARKVGANSECDA